MAKRKASKHNGSTAGARRAKLEQTPPDENPVPGPSTDPATNLIIHDLILRATGRLTRHTVERALLGRRYGSQFARDVVENRSWIHTLLAYGATRVATRSLPGAAIVGGGLIAKTLLDRRQSRRRARRKGEKLLEQMAEPGGDV